MKNIFKLMALLLCFVGLTACGDDEPAAVPTLEVTYANLHGTWQLTEREGQPLPEGIYCYITFNRKEKVLRCIRTSIRCMHVASPVVSR